MAYIGNTPADKFLTLAKQSFSTSATTSYTLDSAVSSTQDIALFINSVRQSPVDAYTVSGTALTLTSATAGTDEMYCVFLGKTVGTVSPASDSVTTAMIQSNAVNNAKMADDAIGVAELSATGTASSSTFLRGDNAWASAGGFECEEYDIWHLTTDFDGDATPIASNLARYATNFEKIGTGMSESSGVFTFPSTGKYLVSFRPQFYLSESADTDRYISGSIQLASGTGLTMGATSKTYISGSNTSAGTYMKTLVDVTDTSAITVRFCIDVTSSGVTVWGGGAANLNTAMYFFKLGAT